MWLRIHYSNAEGIREVFKGLQEEIVINKCVRKKEAQTKQN